MFSSRRLATCRVEVEDEAPGGARTPVDLRRELQEAWVGWLRRGDPRITEALADARCRAGAAAVDVSRTCRTGDGTALPLDARRYACRR